MILRALFWITLVSVLMPREPDLGLGRPGTQGPGAQALSSEAVSWATNALAQRGQICSSREAVCAAGASFIDSLQGAAVRSLAQVKADIEDQQRMRALHG